MTRVIRQGNLSEIVRPFVARWGDLLIALLAAASALSVYAVTAAPSVAAGDIAELQYIPNSLGIPHPNGYPVYILLGWLWSQLPLGALAWQMNLLSALLGALGVGLLFLLLRAAGLRRIAALAGALTWAFQRTLWTYAGLAHRYTLWMLLGIALLLALAYWRQRGDSRWLLLAALLGGLGLASHIAAPLFFLPGVILMLWPGRARLPSLKIVGLAALLFLLPLLLYAYIPLRGTALWNGSPVSQVYGAPLAVLHGLIHPRFAPDAATLWHYFTAGSPSGLSQVLTNAAGNTWFVPILVADEIGAGWLAAGLAGLLVAIWRNRAWGAALWALLLADVLLAFYYRQGNVEAYFLPAALCLAIGLAEALNALLRLADRGLARRRVAAGALALVCLALPLAFFMRNVQSADHRAELATDSYWRTVLALDLPQGAGLVAHWSDLTSLWYFQQAEGLRPDLLGLYLPELAQIRAGLQRGDAVYLAGPLGDWYNNLAQAVRLVPWGPLVRLTLPEDPLPAIEQTGSIIDTTLGETIQLRTISLPDEAQPAGATVPITLTWTSLAPVQRDLHISLRLRQGERLMAQKDDRIISPWFALEAVEPGLDFWSRHELRIPEGLQPGQYDLRAVVYELEGPELPPAAGGVEVDLGTLTVGPQMTSSRSWLPAKTLAPCLALVASSPEAPTAVIGARLGVDLLWEARCQPPGDVALRFSLVDKSGRRELEIQPLDAAYPPTGWQPGQRVLTRSSLRLPSDLIPGEAVIAVEAVDPASGQPLGAHWGPLPLPERQEVAALSLTTRPHQTTAPALANAATASFGGEVRLLGYEVAADSLAAVRPLTVTIAWQAEQPMDASYSVFLHLLDQDDRIVAQRDAVPGDGQLPTSLWLPGEVVTDSYLLQPEQPLTPGAYRLIAGLYDPATGQRLLVRGAHGESGADFVSLGEVSVPPR